VKKVILLASALCLLIGVALSLAGEMPKKLTLGSLADQFEPVVFDHSAHVGMASGCNDCHHQHGTEAALSCRECHAIDSAAFKRSVKSGAIQSCRTCHPASVQAADLGKPGLKAAYHRACFKCHREVGSLGKDPKGCTETCHASKAQAKLR